MLNLAGRGAPTKGGRRGGESIEREGRFVVIKFRPVGRVDPARLIDVVTSGLAPRWCRP